MSLIGSLEDLGLGDILQIISLSQKSGVLAIRSQGREGRIVFCDGLVHGAALKGDPEDLRALLVDRGVVPGDGYDEAARAARDENIAVEEVLAQRASISRERIEELQRESVEIAVGHIFSWETGEFSFDVRSKLEPGDPPLALARGINAQYLAMEGARIEDESAHEEVRDAVRESQELASEAEEPFEALEERPSVPDSAAARWEVAFEQSSLSEAPAHPDPVDAMALATVERIRENSSIEESPPSEPGAGPLESPTLVVIDPDLGLLEWTKQVLDPRFARIHIFQRPELGLSRIRQYLARAETPVVLVSPEVPPDILSGADDSSDFVRRLKLQAPRMPVFWLCSEEIAPADAADGCVIRPRAQQVREGSNSVELQMAGTRMGERLGELISSGFARSEESNATEFAPSVERLKQATVALTEASTRGEVLPLVIRFARETFSRVAMFMVRDDVVTGMAQSGLAAAGGPDDGGLSNLSMRGESCAWIREAVSQRRPIRAGPVDAGDRELARGLGDRPAREAYIAPIESAGQVAALLYADNLPHEAPLGDSDALEVVLQHAGLALERAALERALAELEGGDPEVAAGLGSEPRE